jgi:hypothetical protein
MNQIVIKRIAVSLQLDSMIHSDHQFLIRIQRFSKSTNPISKNMILSKSLKQTLMEIELKLHKIDKLLINNNIKEMNI